MGEVINFPKASGSSSALRMGYWRPTIKALGFNHRYDDAVKKLELGPIPE